MKQPNNLNSFKLNFSFALHTVSKLPSYAPNSIQKGYKFYSSILHRFSYAMLHNDAKNMTPLTPTICVISRFSTKSIEEICQISLAKKKVDYIFEESLRSHNSWLAFFFFPLWIPEENTAKLKKLFNLKTEVESTIP